MKNDCCYNNGMEADRLAGFLKVISEENRLKIICFLQSGERCVCEIWQFLELPQNLISHHLRVLKENKILNSRKEGLNVFYSINNKEINHYKSILNKILRKGEK